MSGLALALGMTAFAIKVLPFIPASLADADVDPHHGSDKPAVNEAQSAPA